MRQIIIAISGRKSAGKTTLSNFIASYYKSSTGRQDVLECSFADIIKDFCVTALGLTKEQCYGTEDQKKIPSKYKWEDVETFLRWKFGEREISLSTFGAPSGSASLIKKLEMTRDEFYRLEPHNYEQHLRSGLMTGRDLMQIFGTEMIRENFGNVWAEATLRRIKEIGNRLSIIGDNRFPNEVESVLTHPNAYVIRLTRSPFGRADLHPSEASLDHYNWERPNCFVLDNKDMSIEEQNMAIQPMLDKLFN